MTPARMPFEYAVLRAVPRVDRDERVNVGIVLYCQGAGYLGTAVHLDTDRLRILDPRVDSEIVRTTLEGIRAVCTGSPEAGQAARDSARIRFGRLTAPRSTVVQPGPVHSGLTDNPAAEVEHLLATLVLPLG